MITKDTITLVRDRTDLVAVVSESVPSLKKRGRRFVGLCPFHKEKTPSFHVNPDTGVYHCFGCKESGDAFTYLQRVEGYSFSEAVRALAERAGIAIEEERGREPTEAERHKKEREALYAAMSIAAAWYEEQLREHPQREYALGELARRGLDPRSQAAQSFRIGYAPPGWEGLTSFLKRQGISPTLAESVGLIVPRSGGNAGGGDARGYYDRFRHRLMFAVLDIQGRVVAFSGRALAELPGDTQERPDQRRDPPPKYINSPESPIYSKGATLFGLWQARHAIRHEERAVLVEGNFDVVSLHARGVENVVAPLGTAFTVDQAKLLRRYASLVTLLFDGDAAGRKAARAAEEPCDAAGLDAQVAVLPAQTDPDDLVRTKGPEALRHLLGQARGLLEYLIDADLDESFNAVDVREKTSRIERVAALVGRAKDPVTRGMLEAYADYAAGRLDLVRSAPNAFPALKRKVLTVARAAQAAAAAKAVRAPGGGSTEHASAGGGGGARIDMEPADARAEARLRTTGPRPSEARVRPRPRGHEERKAIAGAVLDFPALLNDSNVQAALILLEGNSAQIVAGVAKSMRINARGKSPGQRRIPCANA